MTEGSYVGCADRRRQACRTRQGEWQVHYGRNPANPTILPQDYGRGLLLVLGVVWLVTAAITLGRLRLRRGEG